MSKKESVPNRQYTEEFKVEAIRLADSIGGNAAAKRLGVPQSTVTNWVRTRKTGRQGSAPSGPESTVMARRPVSELEAENARLRKELVNAKLDLEIVKKAAAYFVRESR
jgi:transposase